MDGTLDEVTLDEFKLFYGIDRELYIILVRDLCRNPSECLQIMGLWLWLERGGFCHVISKILSFSPFLINELADEALTCLKLINNQFPFSSEAAEIPLTRSLVKTDISLQYFLENRHTVFHEVQNLVSDVYIPALSDIMERARHGGFGESSTQNQMPTPGHAASGSSANQMRPPPSIADSLTQNFSSLSIEGDAFPSLGRARGNETSRYARTMFATFSKGYPVTESEVRQFFTRMFGNCIDSLHMQEVGPDEQALYARIVFVNPSFIQIILNGETKAKFTINGKHVWMRQFVPRNGRTLPCGCPSVGPSTCPHHQ
ncbi:hypothetical protein Pfo_003880 [Paulownia fortunei]|nr:hypothetical protein Pfo_003880 [Paulownia fortunei]